MNSRIMAKIVDEHGNIMAMCGGASEVAALDFLERIAAYPYTIQKDGQQWTVLQKQIRHYLVDPFGGSRPLCNTSKSNYLTVDSNEVNCSNCQAELNKH